MDDMKALSVKQPFATLIVEGIKTIEVRSWPTEHRGKLLICASKAPKDVFWHDPVDKENRLLHAGCAIGIVEVLDCRPMRKADEKAAISPYQRGAWAWLLRPITFCRPDPMPGRLALFDVSEENIVPIANDESDWIFNYPTPQGVVKFSDRSTVIET